MAHLARFFADRKAPPGVFGALSKTGHMGGRTEPKSQGPSNFREICLQGHALRKRLGCSTFGNRFANGGKQSLSQSQCPTVDGRDPFEPPKKPWETILCWHLQGNHHSGGAGFRPSTAPNMDVHEAPFQEEKAVFLQPPVHFKGIVGGVAGRLKLTPQSKGVMTIAFSSACRQPSNTGGCLAC